MDILRRRVPAQEENIKEKTGEGKAVRRVEITVERETITMLVRRPATENQNRPSTDDLPVREIDGLEAGLLPPPIGPTEKGESQ